MTFTKSPAVAAAARPDRKSPLRAATLGGMAPVGPGLTTAEILTGGTGLRREAVPAPDLRRMQISLEGGSLTLRCAGSATSWDS